VDYTYRANNVKKNRAFYSTSVVVWKRIHNKEQRSIWLKVIASGSKMEISSVQREVGWPLDPSPSSTNGSCKSWAADIVGCHHHTFEQ
jgi:hypothetical protein